MDLIALFSEAEIRSDALDLPFLLPSRGPGWGPVEGPPDVLWTRRGSAVLHLPFFSTGDKELYLRARCSESLRPRPEILVSLNGQPLGTVRLAPVHQEFRLVIPARVQVPGDNSLVFTLPGWREPGAGRRRANGIAVSALRTRRLGATDTVSVPTLEAGRIRLPGGSSVAYYLRHEPDSSLTLEAEGGAAVPSGLSVSAETDQWRAPLVDVTVSPRASRSVQARPVAPRRALVRLELANPAEGVVYLAQPRLAIPLVVPAAAKSTPLPKRPNIVLFLVDTLRADYLGAYGHKGATSPRFDGFAREAVVFDDARAQAPWTGSAIASLFTGLHVATHGVDRADAMLAPRFETLAERLKAAGYRTGGVFASWVVRSGTGFEQGFDAWNKGEELYWAPADRIADRALRWVDSTAGPFFLYVHTLEPHSPYDPKDDNWAPFRFDYRGRRDTVALLHAGMRFHRLQAEELHFLESRYEGEILQSDLAFGTLLDGLRARGLLDDSVVVFVSDHGEEFLDHGGTEHGKTLYEEVLHIPLAVRLPHGLRGGRREGAAVQQIDLMPTLMGLADVPKPAGLEGRDLSPLLVGASSTEDRPPDIVSEVRFEIHDKLSLRSGHLKLIYNYDNPRTWRTGSPVELYDLASDPGERTNLAASRPVSARYLRARIETLRRALEHQERKGEDRLRLSPEDREQLRALGYLD